MAPSRAAPVGDRIVEPMIALAGCSKQHRIVVAGSKAVELMLELHRRGYTRAAATANCGHPARLSARSGHSRIECSYGWSKHYGGRRARFLPLHYPIELDRN